MAANISVYKESRTRIAIDGDKCNHCGICIKLCGQGAREYLDDTEIFFSSLKNGKKISLLVAPSFYMLYGERAYKILGWLKSLGIEKIYDVAFGAQICLWGHVNYLVEHKNEKDSAFITQTCPALVNMIELYHPNLISKIIPVQSPMMCTAIYAHKYLGDENEMAFLGPCISKKDEISSLMTNRNVNYSITYKHLFEYLGDTDIEGFNAASDLTTEGIENYISLTGGFKESIESFFDESEKIINKEGLTPYVFQMLNGFTKIQNADEKPLAIDVLACQNGCQEGPGVNFATLNFDEVYTRISSKNKKSVNIYPKTRKPEENLKKINEQFKELDPKDFVRVFEQRYRQPFKIPEEVIDEMFDSMLKNTPTKRNINCGSCGYKTCRDTAIAMAYGYNRKENCIHYMNEFMVKQLNTDNLTGLPNRGMFNRLAIQRVKENPDKAYIFAIGNINRIKVVNDLYGTKKGDLVIAKIGESLCKFTEHGAIVSRFGADNYAICIEDTMENLEQFYNLPPWDFKEYGIDIPVTMRFGVLIVTDKDEEVLSVLNLAAVAMDEKISLTNNTFTIFTKEMHQKVKKEIEITAQMEPALENDEFHLYYQPQYNAQTNALCGVEALCRWIKPNGTIVSPADFIPLSEKNGFIKSLDQVIWEKAFKNIRSWIDKGMTPVPTSINISRVSLTSDDLIYTIARIQDKYNVPPECVHFEITESAYMADQRGLIDRVNRIRDMGFKIAMDDFGSGYSSLNTLKDIPIDILKLDMGFVRDNSNMERGGTILSAVAKMAQTLKLSTIAEGVETQDQAIFLRSIGIEVFQGYLFSKPIAQPEFEEKLKNYEKPQVITDHAAGNYDITAITDPTSNESMMFEFFSGPACIVEIGNDDISLVRINKRASELLGLENWSFAEIQHDLNQLLRKGKEALIKKTLEAMKHEEAFVGEMEFEHGLTKKPVSIKYSTWGIGAVSDGKFCIFIQLEDITQEKLYKKTLDLANTQVKLLLKQQTVGLLLMHVTMNKKNILNPFDVKILEVNDQFCQMSQFTREEVLSWTGKESVEVVHPMDRPGFLGTLLKAITKKEQSLSYDYRAYKKDGSLTDLRILISNSENEDGSMIVVANFIELDKKNQ